METLEIGGQPFVTGTREKFTIATRTRPTRLIWPLLGIAFALLLQLTLIGAAMTPGWSGWEWLLLAVVQGLLLQMLHASIKTLTSGHRTLLHVDRSVGSASIERRYIGRTRSEPIALADIRGLHVRQSLETEAPASLVAQLQGRGIELGTIANIAEAAEIDALLRAQALTGLPWTWDKLLSNPQLDLDQSHVSLTVHSTYDPNAPRPVMGFLLAALVAPIAGVGSLVTEGNIRLAMAAGLAVSAVPLAIEYLRSRERWKIQSVLLDRAVAHLMLNEVRRGGAETRTSRVPFTDALGFEVTPSAGENTGEVHLRLRDGRKIVVLQSSSTTELDEAAAKLRARVGLPTALR